MWATPGVCAGDLLDLRHGFLRALQRGRVGQLDVDDEPALVLLRDEAGRSALEDPVGQHQQAAVDQQHQHADPQQPAHRPRRSRRCRRRTTALNSRKNQPSDDVEQPGQRIAARRCAARSRMAASAGLSVSELNAEMTVETAIVTANWRKNCPVMPLMNAHGTNTAHSTRPRR